MNTRTALMRKYVSEQLRGMPTDHLNTETLEKMIDGYYVGGIDKWCLDYTGHARYSDEHTQIRLRAELYGLTGVRLSAHASVIHLRHDDATGNLIVALERLTVREGVTRDTVTGRTLALCVYSGRREIERIECSDPDWMPCSEVGQYSRVNTPERFAESMRQWLTCYRPGTEASPLDGCYGPTRKDALRTERQNFRKLVRQLGVNNV